MFKSICVILLLSWGITSYAFEYSHKGVIFTCKVLKDQTVCITKFDRNAKTVEIPGQVIDYKKRKTYKVKSIDLHFNGYTYLTEELIIGEGVEELASRCFLEFCSLTKVILPSTLKTTGKKIFCYDMDEKAIEIPTTNVKNILVLSGIDYNKLSEPIHPDTPENIFKNISFIKKAEAMKHSEQRVDNDNNLCALIKVSINKKSNYNSSYIPEPVYDYISFNKKGFDYIWLKDGATSITLFSDDKEFENIELNLAGLTNGEIPKIEAGYIYELKIEFRQK